MKKLQFFSFIIIAVVLIGASLADAATITWVPTTGGAWTTAANWSPSVVPVAGDDIIISADQSANITAIPTITLNSVTINGTCTWVGAASGNTVTVTSSMSIASGKTLTYGVTGGRLVFTLNGTATINGNFAFDAGTTVRNFTVTDGATLIVTPTGRVYDPTLSAGSVFILNSGATLEIGNTGGISTGTAANATVAINFGGSYTYSTGANYIYNGTSAQVTGNGLTQNIPDNVTISNTAGVTFSAATTISGDMAITTGAKANLGTGLTHSSNSLTLGGTGQSSGSWGGTGSGATNVNTTYFAAATGVLNVTAACKSGTWLGTTSTNWNTATNWCGGVVPTASTDVTISSGGNQPVIGAAAVCNNITIGSGATLTISGANTLTVSGDWGNNGGTFTAGTGTVTFNGTGTQTVNGTVASQTFYNLTLAKTAGTTLSVGGSTTALTVNNLTETTGNFTAPATLNINGALTLSAGTFTAGANTNIAGNWTNNGGTFTQGTGTVTFNGTVAQAVNGTAASQTFYNLTLAKTAGTTLSVGGSTTTLTVNNLTETTGNFTAPATLNINGALTLSAGTFTAGANTNIAGNWTNNGGTFTAGANTVTFNGTSAQAIGGSTATTFNNSTDANTSAALSVNTNCAATGTLTVNANAVVSPAAATVISGTGTLTGNGTVQVTRTAATADFSSQYTISNKTLTNLTIVYDGTAAQTLSALAYGGLQINNASGVTLGGNAIVNGTLTLTNGVVTTGANTLSIGSAGSVSGAGAGKYVFGNLQHTFPTGVQSFTFTVGDASNYTPAAVSFANITTGGTLTAKSTAGDHPQIATSAIAASYDVNRYWTLTSGGGLAFSNYSLVFTFVPGDVDAGANTATFIAGNYNGSTWSSPTVGTKTSTSTQVTGLTSFGDFALGNVKTLTITASSGANGTINPSGSVIVNYNASQAFTFTPSTGYHVDSIYVDGAYTGNGSGYTFNNVVANHTISVTFAINKYTVTATAGSNGVINPSGSVLVNYNTSQAFTFTPSTGYHVDSIYVDGAYAGNGSGYTFNNVVANHTISVTFAINKYTVTATAGSNGVINPSGSVLVNYNTSQAFTFTPSTGYHVDSIYVDGAYAGNGSGYTFNNVVANHTISATFAINKYTFTATAGSNGVINPSGSVLVNYNTSQAFTFTPSTGYHVDSIYVDGAYAGNGSGYTFNNVVANHTISVTFAINQFTITASAGSNGAINPSGSVLVNYNASQAFTFTPSTGYHVDSIYVDGAYAGNGSGYTFNNVVANHTISVTFAINKYTITASAGANGVINPSGSVSVNYNASQAFTFTPSTGYHVDSIYVDGAYAGNGAGYTFNNVVANHSISVTFAINQFTITATTGGNGVINPSGSVLVNYNANQAFTFTPSTGYHVDSIYVDGAYAGNGAGYTFNNVVANHSISVTFAINQFTVSASAGANGAISPNGSVIVNYGANQVFTITPNVNYKVDTLFVDGVKADSTSGYTFTNVTSNHSIAVTFKNIVYATSSHLFADFNPSVYGQTVTFTDSVVGGGPAPTGTVIFTDGATVLDTAVVNGGVATFQTSALSVGGHAISGLYSGDINHNGSTSNVLSDTVNKAGTTTSVGADVNPSVYGQTVNFTATISVTSPGAGTPTGNVQFFDGATSLGTVAIGGGLNKPQAGLKSSIKSVTTQIIKGVKRTVVDVTASLPVSTLSAGVHSITAVYLDDANFTGSTSGVLSDTVNNSNTNVALGADVNPSVYGQPVTFTATVTNNGTTPSGTIIFMDGATVLDTATMNGSGVATFQTSALSVGGHAISGLYSGDVNHNGSTSNVLSDTVNKASTTTSVAPDVNPSVYGQTVNFTATISVTSPGDGTPTGNVQFFDGATSLGTVAIGGANKPLAGLKSTLKVVKGTKRTVVDVTASLPVSTLSAGVHSITAVYLDDANFTGSTSGVLSDTVNNSNTNVALGADVNPSVYGQPVTFTATVTNNGTTPSGTIIFMDGATVLDTATMNGSGVATFQTSALSVGGHAVSGLYSGDANHNSSTSNVLSDTVNKASTTTSVGADVNPSVYGQTVNFTATISVTSPGAGTPTGNVQFFDGATSLGTVAIGGANKPLAGLKSTLKVVKGTKRTVVDVTASLPVSTLSAGVHSITAVYLDDANFTGSTSGVLSDTVTNSNTNVALGADVNPSVYGQPVTFTATVTNNGTTPGGTVIFMDGATVLDTATLNGSGVATFQTSGLSVGGHAISGLYSGDANHNSSTSNVLSDTVNKASTTTSVGADVNPSVYGQTVNFTATISVTSPGAGTPTGNVQFFDGATSLGTVAIGGANKPLAGLKSTLKVVPSQVVGKRSTSGIPTVTAHLSLSTLNAGVHSITAVYLDDANFTGGTSSVLSDTVNKANTTTALSATSNSTMLDQPDTLTATVTAVNPGSGVPTGNVIFMDGVTAIDTAVLSGSGQVTFVISTLTVGVHSITAMYADDANFNPSVSTVLTDTVKLSTGVIGGKTGIPKEYALYQNYPNPFNPTTRLQFDIPQLSTVTLKVYNILGQEVATLVNHETMAPGVKVAQLDGSNLASGLYFYRITADGVNGKNFVSIKKMMLVK